MATKKKKTLQANEMNKIHIKMCRDDSSQTGILDILIVLLNIPFHSSKNYKGSGLHWLSLDFQSRLADHNTKISFSFPCK